MKTSGTTTPTKRCTKCSERKPLEEFAQRKRSRDGRESECKQCARLRIQRWAKANRAQERERWRQRAAGDPAEVKRQARERRARLQFNLTLVEYDALVAKGCAICGTHEGQICVDHDHGTGKVRDALCSRCNTALGFLKDDPELARAAAEYLERHRAE